MIKVELDLVKALPEDLKVWSSEQAKDVIKTGQLIFIQSQVNNLLEGPYILGNDTDTHALAEYLQAEMLFVPVDNFKSKIPVLSAVETPVIKKLEHAS